MRRGCRRCSSLFGRVRGSRGGCRGERGGGILCLLGRGIYLIFHMIRMSMNLDRCEDLGWRLCTCRSRDASACPGDEDHCCSICRGLVVASWFMEDGGRCIVQWV